MARNKNDRSDDRRGKSSPGLQPGFDPNRQIPSSNTEKVSNRESENQQKQNQQDHREQQGRMDGEEPVEENSIRP